MRVLGALSLIALAIASASQAADLSDEQAAAWQRQLCPLPREVTLTGRMTVAVNGLRVILPETASDLDLNLATELAEALEAKTGVRPDLTAASTAEAVLDFRRRPEAEQLLGERPSLDQAYLLEMTQAEGSPRILCHALTDRGSYMALKTLKQLLLPTVKGEGAAATVDLPLGRILDWPDLEERGQWGGTALQHLPWLSDLKYNLLEVHATVTVDTDGVGHAVMKPETLAACRRYGVRVVPIIHHLEQLGDAGLFEAYPMIRAQDADTGNPNQKVICFSQPEIVRPITDWLVDLGKTPDVTEVMIWLSEKGKGCRCEQCRQALRFVQELEACVKALRAAQEVCPHLGLRVLLTQGSYEQNAQVLAALPQDVKVSYYHGGLTYNAQRKPMIYPVLEEYLGQGRWMGVYPTLSSNWLTVAPFSNPEFTHYRMTEFVDKGLRSLVAYVVPTDLYYQVNNEGGLEWGWNAHGRDPHEFALSFAVRHGLSDPEKFALWTETIGPVAWDIYDNGFPYYEHWGNPTVRIAAGKTEAKLGGTYFPVYKTEEQFVRNLQRCEEALKLAEELGDEQFIAETKIIRGYTLALQSVYQLSRLVHGDEGVKAEDRQAAQRWFNSAQAGLEEVIDNYPLWSRACQGERDSRAPERFTNTVTLMEKLSASLGGLMEQCGFVDDGKPYRLHVIGSWKTEEFAQERTQTRRLEVSEFVDGPGTYTFRPVYRKGSLGLTADRVALVSYAKDKPEETRQEALDEHSCHAGAWVKDDLYTLTLEQHDPDRGYAVEAHINGGDSTEGDFLFRKLRD